MESTEFEQFALGLQHAMTAHEGPALDDALAGLGWGDALDVDPPSAVAALFELQGAENATSFALDLVLVVACGLDRTDAPGVLLPWLGGIAPPGRLEHGSYDVTGLASAHAASQGRIIVPALQAGGACVALEVVVGVLDWRRIGGIDPGLGLCEVTGRIAVGDLVREPVEIEWGSAVAWGSLALAHELVGAGRAVLELARGHALERVQFGVPISSFQAVRHRLVDTLTAVESADALLTAAWEDGTLLTASMAKAYAGRSARTAAAHSQQVLAGIGFTAVHRFHHYLRRIMVLEQLFGSSAGLSRQLGEQLIAKRGAPSLFPL
jgi:hypothetical protein